MQEKEEHDQIDKILSVSWGHIFKNVNLRLGSLQHRKGTKLNNLLKMISPQNHYY